MKIAEQEALWFALGHRFAHICATEWDRQKAMERFFIAVREVSVPSFVMERKGHDWEFIVASTRAVVGGHAPYVVLEDTHRWPDSEYYPRRRLIEHAHYIAVPMQGLPGETILTYSANA